MFNPEENFSNIYHQCKHYCKMSLTTADCTEQASDKCQDDNENK